MTYSTNLADVFRRAAGYVDRTLKGAKPEDLPVEQPTRLDLVINLQDGEGPRADDPDAAARARGPADSVNHLPYLLPWVRVMILDPVHHIDDVGHEAWPQVKPLLRPALEMRRQIAREGWWN